MTQTKHLGLNKISYEDFADVPSLWNSAVDKIDALADFAYFASINNVEYSERDLGGGFSEYTAIIKDKTSQEEIGRKVTTESMSDGMEVYTTVITLHDDVTTITTTETASGWNQVVI